MDSRSIRFGKLGTDTAVDFAVQELTRYLNKMDPGLSVEILQANRVEDRELPVIWVGLDPAFCAEVPQVAVPDLDDAIAISVENNSGYITGSNGRSVLLAAYRFLKELGCDWVRPGVSG